MRTKPWTPQELDLLRANYPDHGRNYCGRLLPERTVSAIQGMAARLGLVSKVNPAEQTEDLYPIPEPDKLLLAVMRNWYMPEQGGQLRRIV
jgi:hypothetical protein